MIFNKIYKMPVLKVILAMSALFMSACETDVVDTEYHADNKVAALNKQEMKIEYIEISREQASEWYLPFGENLVRLYKTAEALMQDMDKGFDARNILNEFPDNDFKVDQEKFLEFINQHVDFETQDIVLYIGLSGGPPMDRIVYEDKNDGLFEFCTEPPDSLIQGKALLQLVGLFVMTKNRVKSVRLCNKLKATDA